MPLSNEELKESVDRFIRFFRDTLNTISTTNFGESNSLFQKVLYVGVIDALAKTTAHQKKGNRERIVSFIRNFTNWADCDRISLPYLIRLLEKVPDPEFSTLRAYAYSIYDTWSHGNILQLDCDPEFNDIKKHWPSSIPKPLENIQLESLQHSYLFYKYRNSLIHELREPGYGMDFRNRDYSFYYTLDSIDTDEQNWELVYPLGFYKRITETAITNLAEYYVNERIDPYSYFTFGSYWIEELNE